MNEIIIKNNKWLFEQLQVKCWWNNTSKNSMILKKTQSYWVFKTQCDSLKLVKKACHKGASCLFCRNVLMVHIWERRRKVIKVHQVCFKETSSWCSFGNEGEQSLWCKNFVLGETSLWCACYFKSAPMWRIAKTKCQNLWSQRHNGANFFLFWAPERL